MTRWRVGLPGTARFVRRWYQGVLRSQNGVLPVLERIDRHGAAVLGFLLGATHRTALLRDLLTPNRTALVGRPSASLLFARTKLRRYTRQNLTLEAVGGPERHVADLSAIAVGGPLATRARERTRPRLPRAVRRDRSG